MPLEDDRVVQMRVAAVVVDPNTQAPVLILRGVEDSRIYLPVFIGGMEATAIATVLAGVELPRPLTHDLMANVLGELGWQVLRVTVVALREGTFYAEISLVDQRGQVKDIDARPSDSIALALRTGADLYVERGVLAEAGGVAPEGLEADGEVPAKDAADEDEGRPMAVPPDKDVSLDELDPEFFGKYKM